MPLQIDPLAPVPQQLAAARELLIDRLLFGAALLAMVLAPLVLWRALEVGWHRQLAVHGGVIALTFALGVARRRLPLWLKVTGLLSFTGTVGTSGMFSLGMMGAGYFWLLLTVGLMAIFVSRHAAFGVQLVVVGVMGTSAVGFVQGWLTLPLDLNEHTTSASAWILFLAVMATVPVAILYAVGGLQNHLLQLLETLQRQHLQLETQRGLLEQLASQDALTGLPTMRLAADRLQQAIQSALRRGDRVALLFIDLDGFKPVNDRFGHAVGDNVLREVALRLSAAVRAEDTVARIGGDEFVVICSRLARADDALRVAQQLHAALATPVCVGDQAFAIGASIGVALCPDHGRDPDVLRRVADTAMYRAKKAGGRRTELAAPNGDDGPESTT